MDYEVETKEFQGPLDKLLDLVQDEELDISLISLAKVTNDFLSYLEKLKKEDIPNRALADFLVVASKLLLIKSSILIPSLDLDEDEEEAENLEIQLKLYKEIKQAKSNIEENWNQLPAMESREFLMTKEAIFHPYSDLNVSDLRESLEGVIDEIEKLMPVERVKTDVVSLRSKVQDVLQKLTESPSKLQDFSNDKESKSELIALFLAVLHLFKDELVEIEQEDNFGDINVARKKNSEEANS